MRLQEWAGVGQIYFRKVSQGKELSLDMKELCTSSWYKVVSQREMGMEPPFGAFRSDHGSSLPLRAPGLAG